MLQHIGELLVAIEAILERELLALRLENMRTLQSYGYSGLELDSMDHGVLEVLCSAENGESFGWLLSFEEMFPDTLRKSLFVSTYSTFESFLTELCEDTQARLKLTKSVRDYHGRGIRRARDYLVNEAGGDVPSGNRWQTILTYGKLRNCIVHCQGEIRKCAYSEFLMAFVARNGHLVFEEMTGTVKLQRGFCEAVIENFELFLTGIKV